MSSQSKSFTLEALQNHLVELHIYLRQREEARALQELASRQLASIEAKFRRDKEIDEARLKAEHEARMQHERMLFEAQEAMRARQHQEELERHFAEQRKQAQEENFQKQLIQQEKFNQERKKEEISLATNYLDQFIMVNCELISLFQESLGSLLRDRTSSDSILKASHKLKKIEHSVRSVSDFIDALSVRGYKKEMVADWLAIVISDDFLEVAPKLREYLKRVPAVGMVDYVALDTKGLLVPPWSLHEALAWLQPSTGMKLFIGSDSVGKSRLEPYSHAVLLASELNTKRLCGSDTWRLPKVTDIRLMHFTNLDAIGVNVPITFWIEHASAEGRLSAFDRVGARRIVTGSADKFHCLLISF
jgi:hypothetical protein